MLKHHRGDSGDREETDRIRKTINFTAASEVRIDGRSDPLKLLKKKQKKKLKTHFSRWELLKIEKKNIENDWHDPLKKQLVPTSGNYRASLLLAIEIVQHLTLCKTPACYFTLADQ